MTALTQERMASRSAAVLFLGAGVVTVANSLANVNLASHGVDTRVVQLSGLVCLLTGGVLWWCSPRALGTVGRLGLALWGLAVLGVSGIVAGTVATPQASITIPVFMMVILVWLGLTSGRGTAAAFAPVTVALAAGMALGVSGSRVGLAEAVLVIVVSTVVAETIAWAMSELHARERLLAAQARTDPLTGLLNRAAFAHALEASCARQERRMLAFVDLNGFKDVNDTFGHQVGDEVLVEIGRRLQVVARESDVVARFGGDEFVILFRMDRPEVDADALLERIRAVMKEPWPMIAPSTVTASVGIVDDRDGSKTPAELLRAADTAMYSRKHGMAGATSPALLTSRALAHHRAAMDGLVGSFTVLRRTDDGDPRGWLIIEANARVREVYGPLCGDPVGKRVSELDRFADNSEVSWIYDAALASGRNQETEVLLRFPGGHRVWRRLVVTPVEDRTVAVMTWDITPEKVAEQALADSEERSRAIVECAADAIITVDGEGLVCTFNRAAELVFGTSREDAIGRSYLPFVPERSLVVLREAFASGEPGQRVDTTLARASGEEFEAHVAISPVETSVGVVFTAIVRDVTEQKHAEAALRTALECDELTGLPNLRSLLERTEEATARAVQDDRALGLLFVDLDRFTLVNDSLGHDRGDQLLVMVAERIEAAVREDDTVTRVSGDHFVVLCERVDSEEALTGLAARIQEALRSSFRLGHDCEVYTTASIGVVLWHGTEQARDLLRFAHTAMHRAKRQGPAGIQLFSNDMSAMTASRLEDETALRRAVDRDELAAYYQPIVELDTGRVEYMEALVRWNRPGVGIVLPDRFIPVAEETSLIVDIGSWMLRRALTECAAWQDDAPGVGVAVNVSVHQFRHGDLVGIVRAVLHETGLAPELVILEITESVMLEHSEWNLAVLEHIRELGVRLALDDFGTGYSALNHIRRLPIDTIKVDRSFLQRIETDEDLATIRAIVELARANGMEVVAEGIETDATRRLVRSAGCRHGQGFIFARPAPFAATLELLRARAAGSGHADAVRPPSSQRRNNGSSVAAARS